MSFLFWGSSPSSPKDEAPDLAEALPFLSYAALRIVWGYGQGEGWPRMFRDETREGFARKYPEWRVSTLDRFLVARNGNPQKASEQFEKYLKFLEHEYKSPDLERNSRENIGTGRWNMIIRMGTARDGTDLLGFRMSLISEEHLKDPERIALACCWWMEQYIESLGHFREPRMTVMSPTNPIDNAPNLPAHRLVPVLRAMNRVMGAYYPETLQKIIIFPLPWIGRALWEVVKVFLDPVTARKVAFLGGSEARHSDPDDGLYQWVEKEKVDKLWLKPLPKREERKK